MMCNSWWFVLVLLHAEEAVREDRYHVIRSLVAIIQLPKMQVMVANFLQHSLADLVRSTSCTVRVVDVSVVVSFSAFSCRLQPPSSFLLDVLKAFDDLPRVNVRWQARVAVSMRHPRIHVREDVAAEHQLVR